MMVCVVLHWNYGDQGADFKGVFVDKAAAEKYIRENEPDEHERQYYQVIETEIRS